jgi:hypothetical protein
VFGIAGFSSRERNQSSWNHKNPSPGTGFRPVNPTTRDVPRRGHINRPPGRPLDPKLKEFMRFILSRDGQLAIAHDTTMLPLTAEAVRVELAKLN